MELILTEEWIIISGYSNYAISNFGRVKNIKYNRILQAATDRQGYQTIVLYTNGMKKRFNVHTLVAKEFIDNIKNKKFINHKDGNPSNNCVRNLEYVTCSENVRHAFDTNLINRFKKYTGVYKHGNYWRYRLTHKGKNITKSGYHTRKLAFEARCNKLKELMHA